MAFDFINTKKLAKRIAELKEELAHLTHLESFLGTKSKRGRPTKTKDSALSKAKKTGKRAKRGKLGETILKYLSTKGNTGAHVKEIAQHAKTKPATVTAWFYTTGKGKTKKVKPATFALK